LVVPVIKDVDKKSIWEIAREIKNLAEKARAGKLDLNDVSNGTFTLTSVGNIGGMMATPIINQPESAILGLLKAKKRPIVINENGEDKIAIRNIMYLSLSLDHRIVDGAVGARFLNEVIKFMENPALIWV
jgi:pyruvate/2-oxoglutarate dehydrogenase complex dihydrolipoamide acyltransferase (E2) component